MTKEDLVAILRKLLQTDANLDFLIRLDDADLRIIIACIRERIENLRSLI